MTTPTAGPRVLVVTVVHRPDDARILHRQIPSLRAAGMSVTYAAPWRDAGVVPPDGLDVRELPRATGRRRLGALTAAVRLLRSEAAAHDLVLLHDPELLLAVRRVGPDRLPPVVWDVHEDPAAAVRDRVWIPRPLRPVASGLLRRLERWAEGHVRLVLAEDGYAARFTAAHPVVRNLPVRAAGPPAPVPAAVPGPPRLGYVGRISRGRGADAMLELARRIGPAARLELAGDADRDVRPRLDAAVAAGDVVWHGYVPADRTPALLAGARVGLCLLADEPNYRVSLPTKVVEYLAHGLPVVATPLPAVVRLLADGAGELVAFDDVDAAERAVRVLLTDDAAHAAAASRARVVAADLTWAAEGERLVAALRGWVA